MAFSFKKAGEAIAAIGIVGTGGLVAVILAVGVMAGMFALYTALQALLLWVVWNWTAPLFDFIPTAYRHLDFLTVWGGVAVIRLVVGVSVCGVKGLAK